MATVVTLVEVGFFAGVLDGAAAKIRTGDIRGARVRIEQALRAVREIEATACDENGYLRTLSADAGTEG